jgi:hypothetical protein
VRGYSVALGKAKGPARHRSWATILHLDKPLSLCYSASVLCGERPGDQGVKRLKGQEVGKSEQDRAPGWAAILKVTPELVIPAQAGIHCVPKQRWAPAFASATAVGFSTYTPTGGFVIGMPGSSKKKCKIVGTKRGSY